jgi:hypothetical protein
MAFGEYLRGFVGAVAPTKKARPQSSILYTSSERGQIAGNKFKKRIAKVGSGIASSLDNFAASQSTNNQVNFKKKKQKTNYDDMFNF